MASPDLIGQVNDQQMENSIVLHASPLGNLLSQLRAKQLISTVHVWSIDATPGGIQHN
jgi:hypothetical protein